MGRRWTQEELDYLEDSWGKRGVDKIAKKLNRTVPAVELKTVRMKMGNALHSVDGVTLTQLSVALNIQYGTLKRWADEYGMPVKIKRFSPSKPVHLVEFTPFWKWADRHRQLIDFSRLEPLALGPEPAWAMEKRRHDSQSVNRQSSKVWTEEEDRLLRSLVNAQCYTYPEVAGRLNRTEGAIKTRLYEKKIPGRPIPTDNTVKYTDKEIKDLLRMYRQGVPIDRIAVKLGKSSIGIRTKLERMGYQIRDGLLLEKYKS